MSNRTGAAMANSTAAVPRRGTSIRSPGTCEFKRRMAPPSNWEAEQNCRSSVRRAVAGLVRERLRQTDGRGADQDYEDRWKDQEKRGEEDLDGGFLCQLFGPLFPVIPHHFRLGPKRFGQAGSKLAGLLQQAAEAEERGHIGTFGKVPDRNVGRRAEF